MIPKFSLAVLCARITSANAGQLQSRSALTGALSALAVAADSAPNLSVAAGHAETATACCEFSPELFNVGPAGRRCAETACVWQPAKVVSPDSAIVCRSESQMVSQVLPTPSLPMPNPFPSLLPQAQANSPEFHACPQSAAADAPTVAVPKCICTIM